jgi:hypothetical protein
MEAEKAAKEAAQAEFAEVGHQQGCCFGCVAGQVDCSPALTNPTVDRSSLRYRSWNRPKEFR